MLILAIMLGGSTPTWHLFALCAICPSLATFIAYVLMRRKRGLVWLAVVIAAASAFLILREFKSNVDRRELARLATAHLLSMHTKRSPENAPEIKVRDELRQERFEITLRDFDEIMIEGVPPLTGSVRTGVWFSALFPFVMIIAFFITPLTPATPSRALSRFPD